jgi:hypothetical protein
LRVAIQTAGHGAPGGAQDAAARDGVAASGELTAPAGAEPQSPAPEQAS